MSQQEPIFRAFIERILGHEGGYVFNPADPGGETQWGISKRAYPSVDIKALTREGAIQLYFDDFWSPLRSVGLSDAIMYQVLDAGVNHGPGNSTRMLQRAAGVADDGHIGPVTAAAVNAVDKNDLVMRFNAERIEFFTKLSTFATFGKGWMNRVAQNLRYGAQDN
jgi:lysozyme family protein